MSDVGEGQQPVEDFASDGVITVDEQRFILVGTLDELEYAIADYIAKWGEHLTGRPYIDEFGGPSIAGIPCAAANMAMTVIRKNIVASWTEKRTLDAGAIDRELQAKAAARREHESG